MASSLDPASPDSRNLTDLSQEMLQMGNGTFMINMSMTQEFKVFFNIILLVIMTVGVVGNSLVIYVVGRFSSMQTPTNIHMMSLAISDCVYLITIPVSLAVINMENFIFGVVVCKLYMISQGVNFFAGTYSLTVMSFDRYLAVVHPIRSQAIRTTRVTTVIVLVLWGVGFIVMLPLMLYSGLVPIGIDYPPPESYLHFGSDGNGTGNLSALALEPPGVERLACQINWPTNTSFAPFAFTWYTFLLGFLLPVTLITFLYAQVIIRLRTVGPDNKSKGRRDSIRRVTRLVLAIVITYIVLWLPYWVHQLSLSSIPFHKNGIYVAMMLQILAYVNSAINPVLYGFMSQNFQVMFKQLLCCRRNIMEPSRTTIGQSEMSTYRPPGAAEVATPNGGGGGGSESKRERLERLNKALLHNGEEEDDVGDRATGNGEAYQLVPLKSSTVDLPPDYYKGRLQASPVFPLRTTVRDLSGEDSAAAEGESAGPMVLFETEIY